MNEGYVIIYKADNEANASIVKQALEDEGIDVIVQRNETSWLDGAMKSAEGYWGDLLVPEGESEKALEILQDYSDGIEETETDQ